MQDLLFLAHRIPFPPDKGDKIRSWNLLRHLAKRFRIHLGAFIDTPEDLRHAPVLEVLCESAHFEVLNPGAARRRSAKGLLTGEPLSFPYYRHGGMQAWADSICERVKPVAGFAFSSQVAPYLLSGSIRKSAPAMKRIFDFVDVDSAKWEEYAGGAPFPMDWVYRREARLLAAAEADLVQSADATLLVTEAEAALLRRRSGLESAGIFPIGNGVDLPSDGTLAGLPDPYGGRPDEKAIVFTGAMDYRANVDAVTWFARDVLPLVRQAHPSVRFVICGSNPAPAVRALATDPAIAVTGRVGDVRGYVRHADVSVAPLRIARGLQNKVLEAMALATPVVATPQAFNGIDAVPGRDLLIGADAAELAAATVSLLSDRALAAQVGRSARAAVGRTYAWPDQMASLDLVLAQIGIALPLPQAAQVASG